MPIPTLQTHSIDDESRHGRDRRQALLALTQTCRTLRRVFLRYLWQRIELYDSIEIREAYGAIMAQYQPHPCCPPADWALKRHAEVLIGRLETVTIREPSLAFHVNVLNVSVLEYSTKTVLRELVRCIALLPNLHTVQLAFALDFPLDFDGRQFLDELFGKYSYPQVRNACLAHSAAQFLRSCPNVRRLDAYRNETWDGSTSEIFLPPSLEILHMIPFQQDPISKIVKQLPKLREVSLDPTLLLLGFDQLKPLSTLQHLHTIRLALNMDPPRPGHRILYKPGQETTQAALWVRHTYSGE